MNKNIDKDGLDYNSEWKGKNLISRVVAYVIIIAFLYVAWVQYKNDNMRPVPYILAIAFTYIIIDITVVFKKRNRDDGAIQK